MYHQWVFSHSQALGNSGRATRHGANLEAYIVLPFECWQLLWSARVINISTTGVLCGLDVKDQNSAQRAMDLESLLEAEPSVSLQIEAPEDSVLSTVIPAQLVRKTRKSWGLEIAFQFEGPNEDLLSLVDHVATQPSFGTFH